MKVDLEIGERIRALRIRPGRRLTQQALAERAGISVDVVSKLEQGRKEAATVQTLAKIARALGLSLGEFFSAELLVGRVDGGHGSAGMSQHEIPTIVDSVDPESAADALDRLEASLKKPRFVDQTLIHYLNAELASQRRLEDIFGGRALVRVNLEQIKMIERLAQDAPRPVRRDLFRLAGEWAQFVGWMHKDIDDIPGAESWYDRATEWAHRSGSADMVASALSMKSHLAWALRDAERAVDLAEASLDIPGVSEAVRALAAQQLARGHALIGDDEETEIRLDQAERLTALAAANPAAQPPWVYFHSASRLEMQRAIAYTELGRGKEAVELLTRGLAEIDGNLKRDRGWHVARLAVAYALAGETEESSAAVISAAQYAVETGSSQTLADIRRARTNLRKNWPDHASVRAMEDALRTLAS